MMLPWHKNTMRTGEHVPYFLLRSMFYFSETYKFPKLLPKNKDADGWNVHYGGSFTGCMQFWPRQFNAMHLIPSWNHGKRRGFGWKSCGHTVSNRMVKYWSDGKYIIDIRFLAVKCKRDKWLQGLRLRTKLPTYTRWRLCFLKTGYVFPLLHNDHLF
jgi:hypothetical protein